MGYTETGASYNYYKLLQVNGAAHRYSTIIELSVQADPNYYNMQGTYTIRADKYEQTSDRFDGLEIQCSSGNVGAASFYVYNNALWVRSNFYSGHLYYRIKGNFTSDSPLNIDPFGRTTTAPTGFLASTSTNGIKCDFDNNTFSKLPVGDIYGAQTFFNNVSILGDSKFGVALADKFSYDNKTQPHYGLQWTTDSWFSGGHSYWLSGYGGIKMFTTGTPRLVITSTGNVGIGTTAPQAKLAVNGDIVSKRIKVTQTGWADFVFEPEYKLPSLATLEAYIKENKHLPDVPSEREVVKNGVDLGEMNKILLQKIEELTLHVIELQKEINRLKENRK
ncbi:hypothetical protein [Chitinophaga sp. S165]|uniref:hypothetical protein n=1 Tax=Chitinophaga sp. S165 TaxID=2135462 RepID=UPI0018EEA6AD|nr:hypothetical protein [Chitinophaga sp. S165]